MTHPFRRFPTTLTSLPRRASARHRPRAGPAQTTRRCSTSTFSYTLRSSSSSSWPLLRPGISWTFKRSKSRFRLRSKRSKMVATCFVSPPPPIQQIRTSRTRDQTGNCRCAGSLVQEGQVCSGGGLSPSVAKRRRGVGDASQDPVSQRDRGLRGCHHVPARHGVLRHLVPAVLCKGQRLHPATDGAVPQVGRLLPRVHLSRRALPRGPCRPPWQRVSGTPRELSPRPCPLHRGPWAHLLWLRLDRDQAHPDGSVGCCCGSVRVSCRLTSFLLATLLFSPTPPPPHRHPTPASTPVSPRQSSSSTSWSTAR